MPRNTPKTADLEEGIQALDPARCLAKISYQSKESRASKRIIYCVYLGDGPASNAAGSIYKNVQGNSYKILKPGAALQKYVDCFWAGEVDLGGNKKQTFEYLSPASTCLDLIFFERGSFKDHQTGKEITQNGIIYGQKTSFDHYSTTSERAAIFGVKLKPCVLLTTLNTPACEITGQQADLRTLFGYDGEKLTAYILSAQTPDEKARAFSVFLEEQLKEISPKFHILEQFIKAIDHSGDDSAIYKRIQNEFLSKRQFERDFKSLTGFSFRKYIKLKRFENFFQAVQCRRLSSNLTQSAYQFGYYDQAHLNRDFKEFTGSSPNRFLQDFCMG